VEFSPSFIGAIQTRTFRFIATSDYNRRNPSWAEMGIDKPAHAFPIPSGKCARITH
jgi:hypothetical protein